MEKSNSKYIKEHKRIKEMINKFIDETGVNAIIVTELAKESKIDTRVLNKHLELLELGEWGYFSKTRHLFLKKTGSEMKK